MTCKPKHLFGFYCMGGFIALTSKASFDAVSAIGQMLTVDPSDYSINKPLVLVGPQGIRWFWVNGYEGRSSLLSLPSFCLCRSTRLFRKRYGLILEALGSYFGSTRLLYDISQALP